jgi:hypothetical protein
MPPAEKIIRAMQECFAEAQYQPTSSLQVADEGATGAEGWLTANDPGTSAREDADPASLPSAPQGDADGLNLSLDPALGEPSSTPHHDVDDITAALAAHAADPAFSLSQMDHTFLPSDLDPSLEQTETTEDPQAGPSSETIQPQAEVPDTVPDLQLRRGWILGDLGRNLNGVCLTFLCETKLIYRTASCSSLASDNMLY